MQEFVLASHNQKKVNEFKALFARHSILVRSLSEFNVPDIEETGLTFVENALIKARAVSEITGLPALADDSGLVVPALNGEPGIYSARYAGTPCHDDRNIDLLLERLAPKEASRNAYFVCTLVYLTNPTDPMPIIVQSKWHGTILTARRGKNGFGYDPVFYVPDQHCTASELDVDLKNQLSHRGQALRAFFTQFNSALLSKENS